MSITLLPRITVDFELLMKQLLDYPGLAVVPRVDVDSLEQLPLLAYAGSGGHMLSNGYPSHGWEWTLFLNLFTSDLEAGSGLADTVYQLVHGMEERSVAEIGAVASVEDESMFDRIGTTTFPDKQIVQYNAAFTVRVLPA